ncbi:hypothetical protein C4B63_2g99 [Trypanosoma cruzi]|uniref:Endonuclease/exonuclease/phosphatase domain-containing protein n=1 Tax=Trypanosoma cruzi TaxID=5693 RepID=A0A2V2W4E1_TRYCR|nr:hypothetical protein C4B63_2g99 [Trypanosoma cruzi]
MAARGAVFLSAAEFNRRLSALYIPFACVRDAQRQKLLLSGDIEQNPGPIAVLQMNVSCLTPSKLATLMAQGADIIAIQETWKSSEQIASMHTGDYVLYAQSRIGKGGGVAVLVRKTLRSKRIPPTIPQHDTSLEVVVVQVALDQNRDLIVASAYMRPPPQVTQSFRRLVNCLPASTPLLLCGDFNMHHPQWEPFLETSPSEVAAEFLERARMRDSPWLTPLVRSRMPVAQENDPVSI